MTNRADVPASRPAVLNFEPSHQAATKVSTGSLPSATHIDDVLETAYQRYLPLTEGNVADYIPSLGNADPAKFGLAMANTDGKIITRGDAHDLFSIQSISKAFVFALVCDAVGHQTVHDLVGVNNTGLPFNSVMALELNGGNPLNPMVNAGALATTALAPGNTLSQKWDFILAGLSAFAGRQLALDLEVYASESATNQRNQALSLLLQSYGRMPFNPLGITDIYTKQCSLNVSAKDLAIMAVTLADGGVNPVTGQQVVSAPVARDTLAVMASAGLYEMSGDWLYEVGMPGKSGVSGGIIAVSPGKGAFASFSPPLDSAGNSVRGKNATRFLARALGLDIFASQHQD